MSKTLAQLVASVRINLGNRDDKDTTIKLGINNALTSEIPALHDFRSLRGTVSVGVTATQQTISLPADYKSLVGNVRVIDSSLVSTSLIEIKTRSFVETHFPLDSDVQSGTPFVGFVEGGVLKFYPKSDRAYTLKYSYNKVPLEMTSDADTVPIPLSENALIDYATSYVFGSLEQFENANYWQARYNQAIGLLIQMDKRNQAETFTMEQHGTDGQSFISSEPWNDPFVKRDL